ncbi:MAG: hypothetical protein Fur0019_00400 [Tibeticola sp.]
MSLPADITVFERGWLSSNNILLHGRFGAALVDSGYVTHAPQTLALVQTALGDELLAMLLNTHLHSDHCGGNAALQAAYPALHTRIPSGLAAAVAAWDEDALTFRPTGQSCARFRYDALLLPGETLALGERHWQVHAAPGHDPHSVILFEPDARLLISADALWARGFGVVFPELEGEDAFDAVAATLDLIERLAPAVVIPGHGPVFADVTRALADARQRLDGFQADPARHRRHAAKVLLKFKLLEWQRIPLAALRTWARATPYVATLYAQEATANAADLDAWLHALIEDLVRNGAAQWDVTAAGAWVCDGG